MLFRISEWENSDPLPPKEGQKVSQSQCKNRTHSNSTTSRAVQESLTSCSCPLTTQEQLLLPPAPALAPQPAHVAQQWLPRSFSLGSLPWLVLQSTGAVLSRALRGGSKGISWWHCHKNQSHLLQLPLETGKKNQVPVKGVESTNSCNPSTCPLKVATFHQLI